MLTSGATASTTTESWPAGHKLLSANVRAAPDVTASGPTSQRMPDSDLPQCHLHRCAEHRSFNNADTAAPCRRCVGCTMSLRKTSLPSDRFRLESIIL